MTATATPVLIGPDVHNRYRLHTDRMTILFFTDPDDDPPGTGWHTRVFIDPEVAEDHDNTLAYLAQTEREMAEEYRGHERGADSFIDWFYDQINARYAKVYLRLARQAAVLVVNEVPDITGDIGKAIGKAEFDKNACWDGGGCRCTPGVILGAGIFHRHLKIRIDIGPASKPDTGDIPDEVLDELTEYAIEEDSLDITLDEARGGHHRAVTYRELIRRAYAGGRASVH
jgi:hypothetical protein